MRRALNSPIAMPCASAARFSSCRSARVAPATSTSTRLEAPPEIRNSGCDAGGQLLHPRQQARAGRQRALIRHRVGALRGSRRRLRHGQRRGHVAILGDDEGALDGSTERVVGAEWPWRRRPCRSLPPTRVGDCRGRPARPARRLRSGDHRPRAARPGRARAGARGADRRCSPAQLPRTTLSCPLAARRAFASSERSSCSRSRYSGRHIPGDVLPGEARGIELLDARILVLARGDEIVQILVDEPVRADQLAPLLRRCDPLATSSLAAGMSMP